MTETARPRRGNPISIEVSLSTTDPSAAFIGGADELDRVFANVRRAVVGIFERSEDQRRSHESHGSVRNAEGRTNGRLRPRHTGDRARRRVAAGPACAVTVQQSTPHDFRGSASCVKSKSRTRPRTKPQPMSFSASCARGSRRSRFPISTGWNRERWRACRSGTAGDKRDEP
jgi:hypothetical protein